MNKINRLMRAVLAARAALEPHVTWKDEDLRAEALAAIRDAVGPSAGMADFYEKYARYSAGNT